MPALIQASQRSHFPTVCQYHMMCSSQKGLQRAKQITQREIMTTLIKRWHHHPDFNTHCQAKPLNISFLSLEQKTWDVWAKRDVPRDYHLPAAFSQPLGFHYHHTIGLMGRGGHSSGGKSPKRLFSRRVKNRVFWQRRDTAGWAFPSILVMSRAGSGLPWNQIGQPEK